LSFLIYRAIALVKASQDNIGEEGKSRNILPIIAFRMMEAEGRIAEVSPLRILPCSSRRGLFAPKGST